VFGVKRMMLAQLRIASSGEHDAHHLRTYLARCGLDWAAATRAGCQTSGRGDPTYPRSKRLAQSGTYWHCATFWDE
jgi:hypothetical protein